MSNRIAKLSFFFYLFLFNVSCFSHESVVFSPIPSVITVYYGETVFVPFEMKYALSTMNKSWKLPPDFFLQSQTGTRICEHLANDSLLLFMGNGTCKMLLGISGNKLSTGIWNTLQFKTMNFQMKIKEYVLGNILVYVIPHPPGFGIIPDQYATAGILFQNNVTKYINYYEENLLAGIQPDVAVTPEQQHGLYWDKTRASITGIPEKPGTYVFSLRINGNPFTVNMHVHVKANPQHTPTFRNDYVKPSGTPCKPYQFNLTDLLQTQPGFRVSNQISFRIDKHYAHPDWLNISPVSPEILQGQVPCHMAGQNVDITVVAHSNTGGDSIPLTLVIPVAWDLDKKPRLKPVMIEKLAGTEFYENLASYVQHAEDDNSVKLIIEKTDPEAPWLKISATDPLILEGHIPEDAVGQTIHVKLRANSDIGGSSDVVNGTLQVAVDPDKSPHFVSGKPVLPRLYPEQPWRYDFMATADIFPDYSDLPWKISFAKDYPHPYWLRFENNSLIADSVPSEIPASLCLWVVLANVPGGESNPVKLCLRRG